MEKCVYHYCSIQTMISILSTREIWLADLKHANDSKELSWFLEFFSRAAMDWLDEYIKEKEDSYGRTGERQFSSQQVESLETFLRLLKNDNDSRLRYFAACFSGCKDDLGQWRGYAEDGAGVALGFSKRALATAANRCTSDALRFCPVIYDTKQLNKEVHTIISNNVLNKSADLDEIVDGFSKAYGEALTLAPIYKNPSFAGEDEWRLFLWMPYGFERRVERLLRKDCEGYIDIKGLRFYQRGKGLNTALRIGFDPESILRSITLGPKCEIDRRELLLLLNECGIKADEIVVMTSESSYR